MKRFLVLVLLGLGVLQAVDDKGALQEVSQWTKDFILQYKEKPPKYAKIQEIKTYSPKDIQAVVRTAKIKGTLYSFVFAGARAIAQNHTPSQYTDYGFCVGILAHNKLSKGFCLKGEGVAQFELEQNQATEITLKFPHFFINTPDLEGTLLKPYEFCNYVENQPGETFKVLLEPSAPQSTQPPGTAFRLAWIKGAFYLIKASYHLKQPDAPKITHLFVDYDARAFKQPLNTYPLQAINTALFTHKLQTVGNDFSTYTIFINAKYHKTSTKNVPVEAGDRHYNLELAAFSTGLDQLISPKHCFDVQENKQSLNRACFCAVDEMFATKKGEFLTISALGKAANMIGMSVGRPNYERLSHVIIDFDTTLQVKKTGLYVHQLSKQFFDHYPPSQPHPPLDKNAKICYRADPKQEKRLQDFKFDYSFTQAYQPCR
ncbi:hypothetical protein [Helicobacter felis]|uniref:hypothetical protein n=1 Tax=Helicobacter felis TaxID=214 RepID=UPI000EF69EE3|nr:hypothetical protein [Helicobacter felis]